MTFPPLVHVFETTHEISESLAETVIAASKRAIETNGRFTLALSGGSLPTILANSLVNRRNDIPSTSHWWVFLADERCVSLSHSDSNMALIKSSLLDSLQVPKNQIFSIDESLIQDPQMAAVSYQNYLKSVFADEKNFPSFDLILLGMGPDGHTCSLFPGHPLLNESKSWVASLSDSPKPPPSRITLTFPVLNAAKSIVFVTTGEGKADVLHRILDLKESFPAGQGNKYIIYILSDINRIIKFQN